MPTSDDQILTQVLEKSGKSILTQRFKKSHVNLLLGVLVSLKGTINHLYIIFHLSLF